MTGVRSPFSRKTDAFLHVYYLSAYFPFIINITGIVIDEGHSTALPKKARPSDLCLIAFPCSLGALAASLHINNGVFLVRSCHKTRTDTSTTERF